MITGPPTSDPVLSRELDYHERLYSGKAQVHFAKPAVRTLRQHMVRRIVAKTGANATSRVLSIGCGIGDTEILLAPLVREVIGIDLSPAGVAQANADAAAAGVRNFRALQCTLETFEDHRPFDAVIAIFVLHHLTDPMLAECVTRVRALLRPGGKFYSLDPSRYRLSGFIGKLLFPKLMAQYQSDDERQLAPRETTKFFRRQGMRAEPGYYDFVSTPLAGLFPSWSAGYKLARAADEALIRIPGLRALSSNFEIVAQLTETEPRE